MCDLLLVNGQFHTQDPALPRVTAAAIRAGRFQALGGDADTVLQIEQVEHGLELDGAVDGADLSIIISNYGQSGMTWSDGDFDYNGKMMEMMHLGLVAYRVGKALDYDPANGLVTNSNEANDLLKREPRKGWKING